MTQMRPMAAANHSSSNAAIGCDVIMTVIFAEDVVPGPLQASNKEKMLAKVVNQRKETARVALRRAVVVADVVDRHGATSVAISAEEEAVGRHDALAARMAR